MTLKDIYDEFLDNFYYVGEYFDQEIRQKRIQDMLLFLINYKNNDITIKDLSFDLGEVNIPSDHEHTITVNGSKSEGYIGRCKFCGVFMGKCDREGNLS